MGPNFPSTKDKNIYNILILGGSVAMQFGPGNCKKDKNKNLNENLWLIILEMN